MFFCQLWWIGFSTLGRRRGRDAVEDANQADFGRWICWKVGQDAILQRLAKPLGAYWISRPARLAIARRWQPPPVNLFRLHKSRGRPWESGRDCHDRVRQMALRDAPFSAGIGEFGEQPARPLYVMGKLLHCLFVEREQEFRASPLALLPQGKRLLHGVFFGVKPSLSTTRPAKAFWSGVRCTSTLSE